jgi:hypothetical protein
LHRDDEETLAELNQGVKCRDLIEYHLIRLFEKEGDLDNLETIILSKREEAQARMRAKLADPSFMGSMKIN